MIENTGKGLHQATDFDFVRFDVHSESGKIFDILPIVSLVEIYEDIEKPFMKGNVGIRDALGFVNKNIKGGEKISVEFRTKTASKSFTFKKDFIVYEISRREQSKPKEILWQIEFVTEEYIKNIDTKISRSFKSKKSYEIIEGILKNDLNTTKSFEYEKDLVEQKYVTPYQHPFSTINFFKERSLNSNNKSSFMFFENRDGFVFKSIQDLEKKDPHYLYYRPEGISKSYPKYNVVEDYFPTDVAYENIIENKKGGLEGTYGTFLDLQNKKVTTQGDNISAQFFSVFSLDQDNNSRNWLESRNKEMNRFESIVYNLSLAGSTLRTVGDTIYFSLPSAKSYGTKGNIVEDEKLSGLWIIKRIKHSLEGNVYQQVLEVSKVQEQIKQNIQIKDNVVQEIESYTDTSNRNVNCTPMKLSSKGAQEILSHEGIVLNRYLDTEGVWTIGAGITVNAGASINPEIYLGTLSLKESVDLFYEVIGKYENGVNQARDCVEIEQHEFDALVSLAYNVGENLGPDTRTLIQEGKIPEAIDLWTRPVSIRSRRQKERNLAVTGNYTASTVMVSTATSDGKVILSEAKNIPIEDLIPTGIA